MISIKSVATTLSVNFINADLHIFYMALEKKFMEVVEPALLHAGIVCRQFHGKVGRETKAGNDMSNDVSDVDRACQEIILHSLFTGFDSSLAVCAEEDTPTFQKMKDNVSDYLLIVDPLDGTSNYLGNVKKETLKIPGFKAEENYGVMACLCKAGKPLASAVYLPHTDIMFFAVGNDSFVKKDGKVKAFKVKKGSDAIYYDTRTGKDASTMEKLGQVTRNLYYPHCAATNIPNIVMGKAQGYVLKEANLYDIAAPYHILISAGGHAFDQDGKPLELTKDNLKIPRVVFGSSRQVAQRILDTINS